MNTATPDEIIFEDEPVSPGMQLANARVQKGLTQEFVASKLHLRVKIIQLLEADEYDRLPEAVFIKGYIRAYAKLIGMSYEPLLNLFNSVHSADDKCEKALWQNKRESHKGERIIRWFTALFAIGVLIAVGIWWQQNRELSIATATQQTEEVAMDKTNPEVRLTDLSKMQSLLSAGSSIPTLEHSGG